MKTYLLSLLFGFTTLISTQEKSIAVTGVVVDDSGLPLIGANVVIKGTAKGTTTDIDGIFSISASDLDDVLIISYIGYETKEISLEESKTHYKMVMKETKVMEECLVICGASKKTRRRAKRNKKRTMVMDGVPLRVKRPSSSSATMLANFRAISSDGMTPSFVESYEMPDAGQITAGEWNDLNNWEDWKSLIAQPNYKSHQEHWGIYPRSRFSVFATTDNNYPLVNAQATLWSKDGTAIWQTYTDQSGKAELWNGIDNQLANIEKITIQKDGNTFTVDKPKSSDDGTNHIKVALPCQSYNEVEIMFVVDATGSMGDEISFLRSELSDVIDRVKAIDDQMDYRMGAVFYKDTKDDYLTQETPLSSDIDKTIDFIKKTTYGGGGDFPEAVDAALDKALNQDWNPESLSRIIFLLLDAPPHDDQKTKERISRQMREAAAKGIKIVPITASGIDRPTEFLMKFLSIATNSTYVFITDHSGIGSPHLDPVVEDYEVEKLNDLLVRVISSYSIQENCTKSSDAIISDLNMKVYPNPASQFVNIDLDTQVDKIVLRSASGKIVLSLDDPKKGTNTMRLDNLVGGMYILSVIKDDKPIQTKSLIVLDK